jgi:hypothetical protein
MQYKIVDEAGAFINTEINVMGTDVLDAGCVLSYDDFRVLLL